ncbi:MAG: hypothetical protein WCK27_15525 [Verrucomicrobiota bacterium]|nr:hypothetical protein [Verrucomicrobiota bacterium]
MRKKTMCHLRGAVAVRRPLVGYGCFSAISPTETALAPNTQQQLWWPCSRARLRDRHS